jgi:hypothetical protein
LPRPTEERSSDGSEIRLPCSTSEDRHAMGYQVGEKANRSFATARLGQIIDRGEWGRESRDRRPLQ